jgi:hypothetical protein
MKTSRKGDGLDEKDGLLIPFAREHNKAPVVAMHCKCKAAASPIPVSCMKWFAFSSPSARGPSRHAIRSARLKTLTKA